MVKQTGIVRKMIFNTLLVSIAAVVFVCILWIVYVTLLFNKDNIKEKNHAIENRKKIVKNEIERTIDFIELINLINKKNQIEKDKKDEYTEYKEIINNIKFGNNWKIEIVKEEKEGQKSKLEKKVIDKLKNINRNEGIFFYYSDKKDKLIFAKKSNKLKIYLFSEVIIDDLKKIDIEKRQKQNKDMVAIIVVIILILIAVTLLILKVEGKIIKQIKEELSKIMNFFEKDSGRIYIEEIHLEEFNKIAVSINDMLDKKEKSEKELRKAKEEAENANIAKSKFISNTSHEIRTPMNGVIGTIELMKESELNEEQKMFIKIMEDSADHLSKILNDVLDIAKIESGKVILDMEEFLIEEEVEKIINSFFIQSTKKGVELVNYIDKSTPIYAIGDIGKINQIIINILGNSVKFTNKGSIYLTVEKTNQENDEIELKIAIEDTGIGIPEDKIQEIFKPFEQVDMSYTKVHQGTGLGLAITKNLVELMNGKIIVKSSLWKGTIFEIYIKVKDSAKNFIEKKQIKEELKNINILIIDDCIKVLESYKKILEEEGSYVEICKSKEELIQILKTNICIDLIVIKKEMYMKIDKYEKIKIKSICDKVIIIAALDISEKNDLFKDDNIIKYLKKPLSKKDFINSIAEIFNKSNKQDRCPVKLLKKEEFFFKIVIAEDNMMNRLTIDVMFQKMYNIKPIFVENGEECIQISEKELPDIIFMDIQMPVMNGLEATKILKMNNITKNIPVIGVTAYAYQDEIEKFKKSGMEEVLTKPVRMDRISEIIDKYLKKN
jgi:signal transduction histidine kinase/CheY-like chemotaxis protein